MVSALAQVFIGFSGLMGLIIRFIGPLTIVPTIALVGLPLFETAYYFASMILLLIFPAVTYPISLFRPNLLICNYAFLSHFCDQQPGIELKIHF